MKLALVIILTALFPVQVYAQGIIWQTAQWDSVPPIPPYHARAAEGVMLSALTHPNGGILGLGQSLYLFRRTYVGQGPAYGIVSVRVSSSGDSLSLTRLPGCICGSGPLLVRNNPYGSFLAVLPCDTVVDATSGYRREPILATLDTTGSVIDSLTIPLSNPQFLIVDGAFVTPKRILISGTATRATPSGQVTTFETAMIAWPEGVVLWRRGYTPNTYLNGPCYIQQAGPNQIYLTGPTGNHLGAQRIDTLGNPTGGYTLFTDTLRRPVGGFVKLFPNGKFVFLAGFGELVVGATTYPSGVALGVTDTVGHEDFRNVVYSGNQFVAGYQSIIGVNQDGSLLTLYQSARDVFEIQRLSPQGTLQTTWPVSTGSNLTLTDVRQALYLGNDKAYMIGAARVSLPRFRQSKRYWTAYLDGVGEEFNPTEVRGPRSVPVVFNVYPNPAMDRIKIQVKNTTPFRIVSLNGIVVISGSVTENDSIDISALAPGFYQITVYDGRNIASRRFIKL